MHNGFLAMDAELRDKQCENENDRSGSTAITAFVTANHIIVANCGTSCYCNLILLGDSRCLLSRGGTAIPLSTDHKPNNVLIWLIFYCSLQKEIVLMLLEVLLWQVVLMGILL